MLMDILLTLAIGSLGGYLGYKSKIPAGSLIGALLATIVWQLATGRAEAPAFYKTTAQIIAGVFIGMQLASCSLRNLLTLYKPILVTLLGMFCINLISGFLIYWTSALDLKTALFATTPGGVAEMTIIGEQMGADAIQVSMLQFARLLMALCVFPAVAQRLTAVLRRRDGEQTYVCQIEPAITAPTTLGRTALVLAAAAVAGVLGQISGLSGGTLVFSMVTVAVLGHLGWTAKPDRSVKRIAQTLSGIAIGATATLADIVGMKALIGPLVVLLISYCALCLLLGWVLYRWCRLDPSVAFFSCIPAGVSDMALIASDFGSGGPVVAILQLFRFTGVVAILPTIIMAICNAFG